MRNITLLWTGIAWVVLLGHEARAGDQTLPPPSNHTEALHSVASTEGSSASPSMWDRLASGTKKLATGTKDLVMPKKTAPKTTPWAPKSKQKPKTWYEKMFGSSDSSTKQKSSK